MIPASIHAAPARLMESEGINWDLVSPQDPTQRGSQHCADATKNEVAIETATSLKDRLDAGAQGIIAILIGL